jgi:hypothetical protein
MVVKINKLILSTSVFFVLFTTLILTSFDRIEANNNHHGGNNHCGTDVYTFENDGSNSKVEVDFESNDRQIDVFGRNGWAVTKVELDVEDDNRSGFWQYSNGPLNNFNPNPGNKIDRARVTVMKSCATSTPTGTPRPTPTVTPTATSVPTQTATSQPSNSPTSTPTSVSSWTPTATPTEDPCEGDCNEPTSTPVATSTPSNDVCENIDGVQTSIPDGKHLDASGKNCVEFGVPGVPQSTDSGIGGGEVLGASTGQVLGTSTMAATGSVSDALFNSIFTLGSLLTSFGIMKNGKKKV